MLQIKVIEALNNNKKILNVVHSLHLKMKTIDLVKNTCMGMHITLSFGALNFCGLAHIECIYFWGTADYCTAIFIKLFSQIIKKQLEN